ncbi:ATP-grasp domain-containing protein [Streptomyces boluensis]|uniref:ATP-grasp domain-containing protein n=1 Tax=Streptomyces boluensis TaxID=1775135 RepID=A0A964XKJ1_9ACTN|nr:ATP-grasp domain-containing protein [Streptomyces boluensis]NBE50752.1 ATP-grasp domain-containing protein [Streptomyces boluensis]
MTTTPPLLAVVDPYGPGALIAPAFRDLGWSCVAVTTASEPPAVLAHTWRPQDFDTVLHHEGTDGTDGTESSDSADGDGSALCRALRAAGVSGVVTGMETGGPLADLLCSRLFPGRANTLGLAEARRDKALTHQALAEAGLPHLRQVRTDDFGRVEQWLAATGLGRAEAVILKPARSAGTDSVRRLRPGPGLRAAFASMAGRRNALGYVEREVLVQEYAVGTEFSVDTFSVDGVHDVCGVTRYAKRSVGSVVGIYDSVEFLGLDDPVCAGLVGYARDVLDALGVRFGPMHAEIMLRPDGPVLIELNARAAGGQMPFLSRLATGRSQLDRLTAYFGGTYDHAPGYGLRRHVMSVFVTAHRSGVLRNPDLLADLGQLPTAARSTVEVPADGRVAETSDVFSVLGRVVLAGADRDQVQRDRARVKEIERGLQIV